ncbi:asparaginase [Rhizobium puerariae]|uniref:Asparaginase n=1 Tax=Rhizobium puerariae TaxID=1585791 RepID=A0ABV6AE40_9HYPH
MTRRITIIGAGGTIAMQGAHAFDWIDYGDSGIINPVDRVVAGMDLGLADIGIDLFPFRMLPGTGMTATDWFDLLEAIREIAATGKCDGIVVTHGTATLEETAFFLKLTAPGGIPIVVSGAQRPPNTASSDAVANLRQAVSAAAAAPGGVYVVMNGQLFDARDVTKTANHALDAFEAPEFGPLGRIEADGSLSLRRRGAGTAVLFQSLTVAPSALPRVDIAYSYSGADGTAIDAFVEAGAKGIVSVGFAPGRSTPAERAALIRAVQKGVTVVQSSRALRGTVPVQPYNVDAGILGGGDLSPTKIRIVLMLARGCGMTHGEIQALLQGRI